METGRETYVSQTLTWQYAFKFKKMRQVDTRDKEKTKDCG